MLFAPTAERISTTDPPFSGRCRTPEFANADRLTTEAVDEKNVELRAY
jgi:hypothetical protein